MEPGRERARRAIPSPSATRNAKPEQLPKFYILDMFPYPSGAGLHVGHPEGYTATDILARYRRALGYNVLHPMGWDAFGLPAEQYAIKTGQHPRKTTEQNIATFKRQIKSLGFSYDWSREVDTTDPQYFRWTQWIFLQLYNSWFNPQTNKAEPIETLPYPPELQSGQASRLPAAGVPPAELERKRRAYRDSKRLAYVTEAPVWWCEQLGTVLANEEVVDGKSEVGGFPVVRKPMRQWMLRITAYAERLLAGPRTRLTGATRSRRCSATGSGAAKGAEVDFAIAECGVRSAECENGIRVFTTRPDTLFGATYMVLAPEHKLVDAHHHPGAARRRSRPTRPRSPRRATSNARSWPRRRPASSPAPTPSTRSTGRRYPIWIADYVLISYGTGAIMAVPGHDTRDFEFATKFNLPIVQVVEPPAGTDWHGYVEDGIAVNSAGADISISGLPTPEAKRKITAWLEAKGLGKKTINYKLRDWLFSRQRYWGEPFPIVWKTGPDGQPYHEALPESALPLLAAAARRLQAHARRPAAARAREGLGEPARRLEARDQHHAAMGRQLLVLPALPGCSTTTAPSAAPRPSATGWAPTHHGTTQPRSPTTPGVDLYVGGTEHAVLHLLYARFWHKVLFDLGHVSTPEPFFKLVNQGLILGEDGQKMSKSRGNVINPDDILVEYGADAFRLYEMFMGPLEMVKPWNTKGVEGVYRFLGRVWRLFVDEQSETEFEQSLTAEPQRGPELLGKIRLAAGISRHPADRRPAQGAARLHQEGDRGPRRPALQHRHLRPHGLHQRSDDLGERSRSPSCATS